MTTEMENKRIAKWGGRLPKGDDAVNYVESSTQEGRFCGNCVYFGGDRQYAFGSCNVVKGEIRQVAYCDLYDPIVPVPAAEIYLSQEGKPADDDGEVPVVFHVGFTKADDEKQIVYGIALEPEVEDTQDDVVSEDEIESTAHSFMAKSRQIHLQHGGKKVPCTVVESYLAPQDLVIEDETVKKGAWVMAIKVDDNGLWKAIRKGEYTGLSIGGRARREKVA